MIKLVAAGKLSEGDWLERDAAIGNKFIRKSVQGLTREEIFLLKKYKKKVWIKDGVPFTPAFLIAFLIFVYRWVFGIKIIF